MHICSLPHICITPACNKQWQLVEKILPTKLAKTLTSNKLNSLSSKLNNTPEILFRAYPPLNAFLSPQFQAKRFETSQTTCKLIKIYSNACNLTIYKNFQLLSKSQPKVNYGAHISKSDKNYKIWTPIQSRVQPYQNYSNSTPTRPSNP